MSITHINNGESGSSVRNKLNDVIDIVNSITSTTKVIGEQYIISGTTLTLLNIPISGTFAGYLNGQRCGIGSGFIIDSIVSDTITFDNDYTGYFFTADYEY